MQTTRFSGSFQTERNTRNQIRTQRYTDISKVVNQYRGEDGNYPCEIQLKKLMAWTHVPRNEYLEFSTDRFSPELQKKLKEKNFKYMSGIRYKTPLFKWHPIGPFTEKYMEFAKRFGDALNVPSPWVSPYMVHRDDSTRYYMNAKKGFERLLEEDGDQKIPLSPDVKVWMDRHRRLTIRVPSPEGGELIRGWAYRPYNSLHVLLHKTLPFIPKPKERPVLAFLTKHLQFAHALDQDFKQIKKPDPAPEAKPEDKPETKAKDKPQDKPQDKPKPVEAKPNPNEPSSSEIIPFQVPYTDYASMYNYNCAQLQTFGEFYREE